MEMPFSADWTKVERIGRALALASDVEAPMPPKLPLLQLEGPRPVVGLIGCDS